MIRILQSASWMCTLFFEYGNGALTPCLPFSRLKSMKYRSEDTSACVPEKRKNHVAKPEIGVRSEGLQVL